MTVSDEMYFLCTQLTPHRKNFNLLCHAQNNIVPVDRDTKDHYKWQYIFHISPNVCCKLQMEAYWSIYAMQPTECISNTCGVKRNIFSCLYPFVVKMHWACEVETEIRKCSYALRAADESVFIYTVYVCMGNLPIRCMHFFFFSISKLLLIIVYFI